MTTRIHTPIHMPPLFESLAYEHFAGREFHTCTDIRRVWQLSKMMKDLAKCLVRSSTEYRRPDGDQLSAHPKELLFHLEPEVFLHIDTKRTQSTITVFAPTMPTVENHFQDLLARYAASDQEKPCLQVLCEECGMVESIAVELLQAPNFDETELRLHYGEDFPPWEAQFVGQLQKLQMGVSILRGEPGTGKTTFIRHLIRRLHKSHRFFHLPLNQFFLLSRPELTSFWLREQTFFPDARHVVVLEDSEALLAPRHPQNRDQLANLLNLSDGLTGDSLRLQVICTANSTLDQLDPALSRPGRLIGYREFPRLTRSQAEQLAAAHNLDLPIQDDYSLAEIYHGSQSQFTPLPKRGTIGFACSIN